MRNERHLRPLMKDYFKWFFLPTPKISNILSSQQLYFEGDVKSANELTEIE